MNTENTTKVVDTDGKPFDRQKTIRERLKYFLLRFHRLIIGIIAALAVIAGAIANSEKILNVVLPNKTPNQTKIPTRQVSIDPNTHRTPLYSRTKSRVDKRTEYLIEEKIEPWLFISTGKMKIIRHNGSTFAPGEVVYSGSVVDVFWNRVIEPFLEEDIQEIFDEVGAECRDNDIDASTPLEEAASLLRGMVWRVYNRMADIDQRLRTRSSKEKPLRRDVQFKCDSMIKFLDGQLEAAKTLYSSKGSMQE